MDEILNKVEKALDEMRPYLKADGGNVRVVGLDNDFKLTLELEGACGNCPMSTMTFKAGIEDAIKRNVPEIKLVEAVNLTPLP